ncbi:MAG: HD domain-containing phosphohydrolase [Halanaerobiales bacterium]
MIQSALDSLSANIVILDKKGIIRFTNEKWDRFARDNGLSEKKVGKGVNYLKVCQKAKDSSAQGAKKVLQGIKDVIEGKVDEFELEYPCHSPNEKRWFRMKVTPFKGEGPFSVVIAHENITKRKKAEMKMKYMSYHDWLTGFYNRNFLSKKLKELDNNKNHPLSIIMGDINGLKLVNDTLGHKKGDELILRTAKIIEENLRKKDIVVRWGGDEFLIILKNTECKKAELIIDRIKKCCSKKSIEKFPISIAMGCVEKKEDQHFACAFQKAEDMMYRNKLIESESMRGNMINNILITLGEKSHETEEHCNRMASLALKVGKKLGLTNSDLDKLIILASLHDIGKIAIPTEILKKPDKLTEKEWEKIKEHPEIGYRILKSSEEFAYIAGEVLAHHERWDGSGYPRGLSGTDIPLLSRIISVVDTYDVMTNGRPYRKAVSPEKALQEIKENSGTQFDPEVVKIFTEIIGEKENIITDKKALY